MKPEYNVSETDMPWPMGSYCIFKKMDCPEGETFLSDSIRMYGCKVKNIEMYDVLFFL